MLSFQIAKFLTNSKIIKIGNSIYENNNIEHKIIHNINPDETLKFLVKEINPFFCIIFANTKKEVEYIYKMLLDIDNKLNATFVHAGLVERERKNKIKEVKDLKYQYLIATDLVSRGLDINGASHVINYNLPDDPE
jgi:ATP-dependent RNA helicase CshB